MKVRCLSCRVCDVLPCAKPGRRARAGRWGSGHAFCPTLYPSPARVPNRPRWTPDGARHAVAVPGEAEGQHSLHADAGSWSFFLPRFIYRGDRQSWVRCFPDVATVYAFLFGREAAGNYGASFSGSGPAGPRTGRRPSSSRNPPVLYARVSEGNMACSSSQRRPNHAAIAPGGA